MRYAILIYESETDFTSRTDQESPRALLGGLARVYRSTQCSGGDAQRCRAAIWNNWDHCPHEWQRPPG
jgi:hypothetical protein